MWRILHLGPVHLLNKTSHPHLAILDQDIKNIHPQGLANIESKFQCSALRLPQLAHGNGVKTWWIWISENEILWSYTTPPSFSVGRNHLTSFDDAYISIYCFLGEMSCFFCVEYMVHMCVDQAKIRWRGLPLHSGWWCYLGILRCPMFETDHRSLPASVWLLFVVVCEQRNCAQAQKWQIWTCFFKLTNCFMILEKHIPESSGIFTQDSSSSHLFFQSSITPQPAHESCALNYYIVQICKIFKTF